MGQSSGYQGQSNPDPSEEEKPQKGQIFDIPPYYPLREYRASLCRHPSAWYTVGYSRLGYAALAIRDTALWNVGVWLSAERIAVDKLQAVADRIVEVVRANMPISAVNSEVAYEKVQAALEAAVKEAENRSAHVTDRLVMWAHMPFYGEQNESVFGAFQHEKSPNEAGVLFGVMNGQTAPMIKPETHIHVHHTIGHISHFIFTTDSQFHDTYNTLTDKVLSWPYHEDWPHIIYAYERQMPEELLMLTCSIYENG